MRNLWLDPTVMGAIGVLVVGFVLLILALRALRKSAKPKPIKEFDFPILRNSEPLSVLSPDANPFSVNAAPPPPPPAASNREVLDKVDLISQRLVDMQMLLNKQIATPAQAGAGSGLSPETLDKLLKITGAVAQHIEVLQKALGGNPMAAVQNPTPLVSPVPPAPLPASASQLPSSMQPLAAPPRAGPTITPVSQVISGTKTPPPPTNP